MGLVVGWTLVRSFLPWWNCLIVHDPDSAGWGSKVWEYAPLPSVISSAPPASRPPPERGQRGPDGETPHPQGSVEAASGPTHNICPCESSILCLKVHPSLLQSLCPSVGRSSALYLQGRYGGFNSSWPFAQTVSTPPHSKPMTHLPFKFETKAKSA